ncbi:MAG TPA: hypothetical protein VFX16_07855 [Pseudonocardiaceae bacterium]|nr:hypothetical protein [Pseudonocardiaceae bacterium]
MTRLIAVTGSAPGIGKSTLCAGLNSWLTDLGLRVDHFREEDTAHRVEFAPLVGEFAATGQVRLATLLRTTADYLDAVRTRGADVALADSLVPFLHSLLAWGHSQQAAARFLDELTALLAPLRPVFVHLDGDQAVALRRAAEREGPGWLDWFITKLSRYRVNPVVHDFDTACTYLRHEREVTIRLIRAQPWDLVVIDDAHRLEPADVERAARAALGERLTLGAARTGSAGQGEKQRDDGAVEHMGRHADQRRGQAVVELQEPR